MQNAKPRFQKLGLRIAAISYDDGEILKSFAARAHIDFPLLADPDSKIISAFDVLNREAVGMFKGMARPGYFFLGPDGTIREKFFEAKYRERLSGNSIIAKLFPELAEEVSDARDAPHLRLALGQSDRAGFPGGLITLTAEITLPPDVHVYAPGTKGYKPIHLALDSMPELDARAAAYPQAKILFLAAIKERVPVYEGKFHIRQDVHISSAADFSQSLGASGKTFAVTGKLEYQACDKKICYLPDSVPVRWELQVLPLDRQRAPEAVRHKAP